MAARKGGACLASEREGNCSFFNAVCGNTNEARTKYTGLQAPTAPSTSRIVWQGSVAADESLTSSNTFTLGMIDKAKEMAITATPLVRPINAMGKSDIGDYYKAVQQGVYVAYLHPLH